MQGINLNRPLRSRRKVRKGFINKQAILGVLGVFVYPVKCTPVPSKTI